MADQCHTIAAAPAEPSKAAASKPSLLFMSDELDRLVQLAGAMRWACAGRDEQELAALAEVVLAEIEAFEKRFETFRLWPAEGAA